MMESMGQLGYFAQCVAGHVEGTAMSVRKSASLAMMLATLTGTSPAMAEPVLDWAFAGQRYAEGLQTGESISAGEDIAICAGLWAAWSESLATYPAFAEAAPDPLQGPAARATAQAWHEQMIKAAGDADAFKFAHDRALIDAEIEAAGLPGSMQDLFFGLGVCHLPQDPAT